MNYLVVNQDGIVENVIAWNGNSPLELPGKTLIPATDTPVGTWIGWGKVDGEWVDLRPKPEPETTETEV